MPKVNGKFYDWGSITVDIPGLELELQEISYDDELETELIYGKGKTPRGYAEGKYKASGKISILRDDYNDILDYCKKNNKPFYRLEIPKILISYANDGEATKTDVLNNVKFQKRTNKVANGDKGFKVDLDLLIAGTIDQDGVKPV